MYRKIFFTLLCMSLSAFAEAKPVKKVALLFLMEQDHNQAALWKKLLLQESEHFTIYVHSKKTPKDTFFKKFAGGKPVHTSWMKHMRAWRKLIHSAIHDEDNCKFVFLSESCIPLRPLNEIYEVLTADDNSYINYFTPRWLKGDAREVVLLPPQNRFINSEWIILNRTHANLMIQDRAVLKIVQQYPHSCEAYPACLLSFYNYLKKGDVVNKATTYVDFLRGVDSHPYTFQEPNGFDKEELRKARAQGLLFARKFSPEYPVEDLLKIIYAKDK